MTFPMKQMFSMKQLLSYFARGAIVAVPIATTLYLVYMTVREIDGILNFNVPGLGLLITLISITLLGATASSVVSTRVVGVTDALLGRLPLVKILYTAMKDLVGAFAGDRKSFDRPVMVELPGGSGVVLGFATRQDLHVDALRDHVAVYLPQSYNFAGNLILFPRAAVRPLHVKSSDLMGFIVSGGVSGLVGSADEPSLGPTGLAVVSPGAQPGPPPE